MAYIYVDDLLALLQEGQTLAVILKSTFEARKVDPTRYNVQEVIAASDAFIGRVQQELDK